MYRTLCAPVMVQWEVTPACNHLCLHCYNYWRQGSPLEELLPNYLDLYEKVVDEIIANKIMAVVITGGEPLSVFGRITHLVKRLTANGVRVTMNSNLTLLTDKLAEKVKECGINSILTSMPSADPETNDLITNSKGSLERIVRGIRVAKENGIQVFVNMVASRINKHQVMQTAQLVASLGLKNFAASRASDPSSGGGFTHNLLDLDEFHQLQRDLEAAGKRFGLNTSSLEANPACSYDSALEEPKYRFCSAGKTTCTIGFNGEIRPCNRAVQVYGNIRDGLAEAWKAMAEWRTESLIPEECSACPIKIRCAGGCKADAYAAYGDIRKPDPLCDFSTPVAIKVKKSDSLPENIELLYTNRKLRVRQEKFGGILFVSTSYWTPVDQRLTQLFLSKPREVTVTDIQRSLGCDRKAALKTAAVLCNQMILERSL